ncbi:MAG TPA: signal recognition particle protein, partial [Actinomycetota bacterium]|nr:signal recognition particle protein [Actinomycetota bacterium]
QERNNPQVLNGGRRKRIAVGSGTSIQEVNKLVKQFDQVRKMMKTMSGGGGKGKMKLPKGMNLPPGMGL